MRAKVALVCAMAILCSAGAAARGDGASAAAPRGGQHLTEVLYTWTPTSFGAYLAPNPVGTFLGADGGLDIVVHFHGARLAEHEWRAAGLGSVIVDADFGGTSTPFHAALERPERFGEMLDEVLGAVRARAKCPEVHLRRLAIVSWSAGYAAVAQVLAVPRYFDAVDAVILLDSLHAPYVDPIPPGASEHGIPFRHLVDEHPLAPFILFGRAATEGRKLLVLTHSSILPPDYASTTETGYVLTLAVDVRIHEAKGKNARGMFRSDAADDKNFHMRGYWGATPENHLEHLHFLDDVVREFLVPRWR